MFGFLGKDAEEGLSALKKKIAPKFPSAHLYWNQPDLGHRNSADSLMRKRL